MSMQVEKLEHNMAKLTIEVEADEFLKAMTRAYQKNKNKMSIPGFRKGKVPQQMIEKMYGPEVFYEDAANFIIPDAYEKELAENKEIEVVSQPSIDVTQCEKGKSFIFTAEVALKPEIELGKYKGVKIDKIETDVTDEEVDKEIEKEREANSRTITVTDRPVKDKDMTIIDFEGFVDGEAFEGGKGENYPLTIGSGSFIPGFEDQLIGAKIDEETEVKVTFPEDYHAEELKGKDAVFKVTVHEIKEKELPDLDDEFASEVSEFDTLKEYKEDVKKKLLEKKETEAKRQREDAVIEAIVKDSKMDIPDAMIDTQTRQMAQDYAGRLQQQGLTLDQYFKFTGMDMDKFLEQMRPGAQKRIESRLVLEAVAKAENFEISDEEFDHEIDRMAEMYQMEADKLKDLMGDYEKDQIIEDLKIQKAVDYVTKNCKESKPRSTKKKEAAD
ncbi:MAG TPA: trigger factor [Lachnospiraceae bacterium]|nr:trigger factor [Lachnospiraceae bacterium]